jgi:DNA-binding PadR family transcriptional regulator
MLELAILGLLKEKAMHGYELKQQLTQKLGHFWQVSYGSLYPALRELRQRGCIEPVFDTEETSRRKNVYRITASGEQEFLELIEDPAATAWEEEKFPLRFAFFRYVKPEIRLRLLERRKTYLQEKLADLRASLEAPEERIDSYTRSLIRHGLEATTSDIAWLDELISAERRLVNNPDGRDESDPDDDSTGLSPGTAEASPEPEDQTTPTSDEAATPSGTPRSTNAPANGETTAAGSRH